MRLLPAALAVLAACAPTSAPEAEPTPANTPSMAFARLVDANGAEKGRGILADGADFVEVKLTLTGWQPGTYAFHVHAAGTCTPPDFMSAGPHFNPTGEKHGAHKGDLPNVVVGNDGRGTVTARIPGLRIARGDAPILDADGAALVVHANPDDGVTDPAGNAGARIACGEIVTK